MAERGHRMRDQGKDTEGGGRKKGGRRRSRNRSKRTPEREEEDLLFKSHCEPRRWYQLLFWQQVKEIKMPPALTLPVHAHTPGKMWMYVHLKRARHLRWRHVDLHANIVHKLSSFTYLFRDGRDEDYGFLL